MAASVLSRGSSWLQMLRLSSFCETGSEGCLEKSEIPHMQLQIMPPKCSPCLMLTLPQQSNTTSYLLAGTSPTKAQGWESVPSLGLFIIPVSFHLQHSLSPLDLQSSVVHLHTAALQLLHLFHCSPPLGQQAQSLILNPPCLLGLGCPSICWNLWSVFHANAELNPWFSHENHGHISFPRFSS